MVDTSKEQAMQAAERHLDQLADKQGLNDGGRYVVLKDHVVDKGIYWSVSYQSAAFVETGEVTHMLAGNWPLMVSKINGKVDGVETPEWMKASSPSQ